MSEIQVGKVSIFDAVIVNVEEREGKKGVYYTLTLKDDTGSVEARLWSDVAGFRDIVPLLIPGTVLTFTGKGDAYKGTTQFKVTKAVPSTRSPLEFAERSLFSDDILTLRLTGLVEQIHEPLPRFIATTLVERYKAELFTTPAAIGVHHNWIGGLIEHTCSLGELALRIADHYESLYDDIHIQRSRLLCAIIAHDLGKFREYDISTGVPLPRADGVLVNHIVWGAIAVSEVAEEYRALHPDTPESEFRRARDELIHLVVSHHGTLEWGSPVVPATYEAIILHQVDNLDAKVMNARMTLGSGQAEVPGLTRHSRALGTRLVLPPDASPAE